MCFHNAHPNKLPHKGHRDKEIIRSRENLTMLYLFIFGSFLCGCIFAYPILVKLIKGIIAAEPASISDNPPPKTNKHDVVDLPIKIKDKYDVFVSFRGEDVRDGFRSHLAEAFRRNNIDSFIDEKLERGEEIWPSLVRAIEGSSISVIILSENYATSSWCLKELVKILEFRDKNKQIVIPVFYGVDPTDVRHQTGSYKAAFSVLGNRYPTMLKIWGEALNETAKLSGIKLSDFGEESELVKEIINVVLGKLKCINDESNNQFCEPTLNLKGLFGTEKSIADVEALLRKDSKNVRIVGIWGMGGIGKTTIAEQVFNKVCSEFDGSCFLSNVREETGRHGTEYLKEKLFSKLLGKDVEMKSTNVLHDHHKRRIGHMKALIVLDDVHDSDHLELFGSISDFGTGSRIIVTTRDTQLLTGYDGVDDDDIYKVELLTPGEALKFFNSIAFKQSHLETEYHELSERAVGYAKGVPLVLKVLGHLLRGNKDKRIWESLLDKLMEIPIKKVYDALRLSYDYLDHKEQQFFLDLACFLCGLKLKVDLIKSLLKDSESDNSMAHGLERLKDMALITISEDDVVSMHDMIQEMGWDIVRQESNRDPGKYNRLWNSDDVYEALKNDEGNEVVRSICMDYRRELKLSSQIFTKMSKLQFLYIDSGVLLPEGLQSLPTELRYLFWRFCPLKSFPENFCAEKLVILDFSWSKVTKLWHGVQNLVNLKQVNLRWCESLKELPDFTKATNLEVLIACACDSLTNVHSSIITLDKLEKLDLSYCSSLTSLTSNAQSNCLSYLNLCGCRRLVKFSVTSENMKELNLEYTSIESLPLLFESQSKLEILNLKFTKIEVLPSCMVNLTSLRFLNLENCARLEKLPELPRYLETLLLGFNRSLKTLSFPSTAQENKKRVDLSGCTSLDESSLLDIGLNAQTNVMKFARQYLSAPKKNYGGYNIHNYHSYQAVYVFPGRQVPEWLVHKTSVGVDSVIIDLSPPSPPFAFIFCFIIEECSEERDMLKLELRISDGEDEKGSIEVFGSYKRFVWPWPDKDHVYVICDERCCGYLNSKSQNLSRFQIKATSWLVRDGEVDRQMDLIKGFGVSLISGD